MSLPGIQALPSLQLFLSLAPLLNLGMQGSPQLYPCTPSLSTGTHLVTLPCSWLSMPSVCPRPQVHPELSESSPGCRPEHSAALLTSPWDTPWACPPQQGQGPALSSPSRQPSSPQETGSGLKLLRPEPGLLPDVARSLPCPHWLTRPFFYLQVATSLPASGSLVQGHPPGVTLLATLFTHNRPLLLGQLGHSGLLSLLITVRQAVRV